MASTYSTNLRIELIGNGEQSGTWGTSTNNNLGELIEQAIAGYVSVTVGPATSYALTALDGVIDESRNQTVKITTATLGSAFSVYMPPAEKTYTIWNATAYTATLSAATAKGGTTPTGGTTVAIPANTITQIFCDATNVYAAMSYLPSLTLGSALPAASGGTGFNSYTIGDILYAATSSTLAKLADVATGNALISGGVGVAPTWGKIGLTTHVSGTLPLANGGTNGTDAATARTGIGATTVGSNFFTLANPSAITFIRVNADNTVSTLDAATFRTAIGAGTGSGSVTSVGATSPVASSGGTAPTISLNSAYGDTLNPYGSKTANQFLAAPNGSAGAPSFRAIVAADIPTLNQNTTGSSGSCTGNSATATTATTANALNTGNNYQVNSLGVGTAGSGTAGEIRATNNITAYYSSDVRLKENIHPITNALYKLSLIRGVEFDWTQEFIEQGGGEDGYFMRKHDVGVIAQEMETVLPEVVAERPDGYKAVKYDRITALLIEAVKELQAEVAALRSQIK